MKCRVDLIIMLLSISSILWFITFVFIVFVDDAARVIVFVVLYIFIIIIIIIICYFLFTEVVNKINMKKVFMCLSGCLMKMIYDVLKILL